MATVLFPKLDLKILEKSGLRIGKNTYIGTPAYIDHGYCWLISIGNNCIIAPDVIILAHDASTKNQLDCRRVGRVIIGSNTYVGVRSIICPGVKIGKNVIIGAGSVVTHDVPDNCVACGNPARVVRSTSEFVAKHRKNLNSIKCISKRELKKSEKMKEALQNATIEKPGYVKS
jgi:maltose O-acetyltransferase